VVMLRSLSGVGVGLSKKRSWEESLEKAGNLNVQSKRRLQKRMPQKTAVTRLSRGFCSSHAACRIAEGGHASVCARTAHTCCRPPCSGSGCYSARPTSRSCGRRSIGAAGVVSTWWRHHLYTG
jgi:hypothetical protein